MHFNIKTAITFTTLLLLSNKELHASGVFESLELLPKAFMDTVSFLRNNLFVRITARPSTHSPHNDWIDDVLIEEGYVLVSDDEDDAPGEDFLARERVDYAMRLDEPAASIDIDIMSEASQATKDLERRDSSPKLSLQEESSVEGIGDVPATLHVPSSSEIVPTMVDEHLESPMALALVEEPHPAIPGAPSQDLVGKQTIPEPEHIQVAQHEAVEARSVDSVVSDLLQEPSVPISQPVEVVHQEAIKETTPKIVIPSLVVPPKAKLIKKKPNIESGVILKETVPSTIVSLDNFSRAPILDTPSAEQVKEERALTNDALSSTGLNLKEDSSTIP